MSNTPSDTNAGQPADQTTDAGAEAAAQPVVDTVIDAVADAADIVPGASTPLHPWRRYVALGDSFTEGVGDPEPTLPGGMRGWADRVAEVLSQGVPDFAYANLAVRGKLIEQIMAEQLDAAVALQPDLVSISAGGNDVIRPGADPDAIALRFDDAVARLSANGATVVIFTGVDVGFSPVFRALRGKVAIYNENVRAIAEKHDAVVADMWGLKEVQDPRFWSADRLHLNALGHHEVARVMLRALNVDADLRPHAPGALASTPWRQARAEDLVWAREHFVPWVLRRIRHVSSGDHMTAKRPEPAPYAPQPGVAEPLGSPGCEHSPLA